MGLIPNKVFNFATTPRPALRPTQPPFQELVEDCCLRDVSHTYVCELWPNFIDFN